MQVKVVDEAGFQILTSAMSIGPSQTGYVLEVSADGKNFSPLFSVGANTTKMATNLAPNSYYRLKGNVGEVVVNWSRSCVTEGGGEYILPPATENTLGGVKIGSGITVTADGTISADGENKTVVDFDTTSQAERANIYSTLKTLYDGGSGSSINKNYDFYKTVDTKQGLKIDYYTFADGKLVFGKVVSPNNSADTIVYEQVVLISADGSVEVVTNTVGRPYTAGANISISNQNQISVSGLSTINGSAITAGGNIVIGGGDKLMPVGELPATADTGTVMATSGSTGIGKWSVDGYKYTFTILDTDHSKWATRQKIAEMHPGYLTQGGDLTNIYCRYFDGGEYDPYWEFYFENSEDEFSSFYLDEYDEYSDTRYDFIDSYGIPPEYENSAKVSVEWNNLTHQFTIYSDMDAYADPIVYLPMVNTENYPGAYFNTFDVGTFSERGAFQFDGSDWQSGGSGQGGGESVIELTQAQYDALSAYAPDTTYIITDATPINMDNYATTADTAALSGDVATLSGSVADKADKQNVTANIVRQFPRWNAQGVVIGTTGSNMYEVSHYINGSSYTIVRAGNSGNMPDIYAPTSKGTAGQILQSPSSGNIPTWSTYKFQFITQTAYDALSTKDSTTIYFIVGD